MASALLSSRHSYVFCVNSTSILPLSSVSSTSWACRGRIRPQELCGAVVSRLRCTVQGGGGESHSLLEREGFGGASSSDRLGFRKNFSFPRQQVGNVSSSDGERAQIRSLATRRRRTGFSSREHEKEEEEKEKVVFKLTPMKVAVWLVVGTVVLTIVDAVTMRTVFNPFFWMYASYVLVLWPGLAAVAVAIATLVTAYRTSKRQPKEWEQVVLLLGSLTWLILVPLALAQGFVEGWPLILFVLYAGFFFISAIVRYRRYGDLTNKDDDKQWETLPSRLWQIGFIASVVAGHWFAAFEAPFLLFSWNFHWKTILAIVTLAVAVVTHYSATYFLGKYFDRLVRPRAVVMFGPYRVIRHPIYASYILLFAGYCLALRSYRSLFFLLTACIVYYEQRTKLEEDMLVGFFGDLYTSYRERVANKYFPLLY